MRCEDCRFYDNSTQHSTMQQDANGLCRVNPPVADDRDHKARWPFVEDTDWCGSFVERQTPLPLCSTATGCETIETCRAAGKCPFDDIAF